MAEASIRREYETIYIVRPDAGREATEGVASRVAEIIHARGTMTRVENWGRRKLAYNVGKQTRGVYVYLKYLGAGDVVSEVERTLRLQESVMKFQTVRLDDVLEETEVDPETVKFEYVEPTEEEEDETLAQELGLEAPRYARAPEPDDEDEEDSEDNSSSNEDSDESSDDEQEESDR